MSKPILIEPGTKYFLSATLKASNIKRKKNYIFYFNVALFSLFSIIVCLFLSYKYYNKPSEKDKEQKARDKEIYILSKVRNVIEHREKQHSEMLTNLPKFESDYKLLHERYYKL